LRIEFAPEARADLVAIEAWISADDPAAAKRVISRIRQAVLMLGAFPALGHPGDVAGTRELAVVGLPYRVIYRAGEDVVDVLAIIHGRRAWP
jgi:plasmid stabilization system protein ParE